MIVIFCSRRDKGIKVRLGEWDASSYSEKYPYREYSVSRVDIHPNFNISILANDIAIITLDQSVSFTKLTHITPARLPENFSNQQNHRYLLLSCIFVLICFYKLF